MILHINHHDRALGIFSLLPREDCEGVAFDLAQADVFSRAISELYVALIENFSTELPFSGIPSEASKLLIRNFVVPIAHCFSDRLLRLARLTDQRNLQVVMQPFTFKAESIESFQTAAVSSATFNQAVLSHLANIFKLPLVSLDLKTDKLQPANPGFINYNNQYPASLSSKVRMRLQIKFSKHLGAVPCLGFERIKPALADAGLFGWRGFADFDFVSWDMASVGEDIDLRRKVIGHVIDQAGPALTKFFATCNGDSIAHLPAVCDALADFFLKMIPTNIFESAPDNLHTSIGLLRQFRQRPFFVGGAAFNTKAAYFRAAARQLGSPIVTTQHGGHYGYIDDFSSAIEGEYKMTDEFASWGWTELPQHAGLKAIRVTPLPSPLLQTFREKWDRQTTPKTGEKKYDILFMPNKIKLFPDAPAGNAVASPDKLAAVIAMFEDLANNCKQTETRLFLKSYNAGSDNMLKGTMDSMKRVMGNLLTVADHYHKGLTKDLVAPCNFVVLDQPGTAFCECLAAAIPVLVLWPRTMNYETAAAKHIFIELEKVGVVHRTAKSLCEEVQNFKANPVGWTSNARRQEVIAQFMSGFARCEKTWSKSWRAYIKNASS